MGFENLSGRTFGQYELRDLLGMGGMGAVYRAYQSGLDREVAVKVLPRVLAAESGYIERFIREARTAGLLEHPHIVQIYDYGTQGDISYLVMSLLRGGSLSQRLAQREDNKRPRASLGEVAAMLNQIGSALDYAHHEGVLHRDIKPANIMFDNQGRAYVTDFGIAKLMGANTALTGTGVAMGSPSYMPPEQWAGQDLTPAADQYALGVTIYQTIAGRLPFEADSAAQLMYKHFHEEPTPLTVSRSDIPTSVMIVMNRAMAKAPEARFPNITQFAQSFESAIEGSSGEATNFFLYKLKSEKPRPTELISAEVPRTPSNIGIPPSPTSGVVPPQRTSQPTGQPTIPQQQHTPTPAGGYVPPNTPPGGYPPGYYPPGSTPSGTYTGYIQQPTRPWYSSPITIVATLVILVIAVIVGVFVINSANERAEHERANFNVTLTGMAVAQVSTSQQATINAIQGPGTPTFEPTATTAPAASETSLPSDTPTDAVVPTAEASTQPTEIGAVVLSETPTDTAPPTDEPTVTDTPTDRPTDQPLPTSTDTPTDLPSPTASVTPSAPPPTATVTNTPTDTFTPSATNTLAVTPTESFTPRPTSTPEDTPTETPEPQTNSGLQPGDTRSGTIDDSAPEIRYEFEGTAGQVVIITASATSGNLDPSLILYAPDGSELASNDDISGTDRNAELNSIVLPVDGTYTATVLRFRGARGSSVGTFDLSLLTLDLIDDTDGTELQYGVPVEGRIDDAAPTVAFTFVAMPGMTVSASIFATSGNLDTVLQLYAPDGSLVAENDDAAAGSPNSSIDSFAVTAEGVYTLVASRFRANAGNTTGDFTLTLTDGAPVDLPDNNDVAVIVVGQTISDSIDNENPSRFYTYSGTAGETITVSLTPTSGTLDTLVRILNADGTVLAENDDAALGNSASQISGVTLPVTGEYTVVATRFREATGDSAGTFDLLLTTSSDAAAGCGVELTIGCPAYVSSAISRPVNLRSEPRANGTVVTSVPASTALTIIDGPEVAEAFIWWKVRLSDGTEGWMVERISFNTVLVAQPD